MAQRRPVSGREAAGRTLSVCGRGGSEEPAGGSELYWLRGTSTRSGLSKPWLFSKKPGMRSSVADCWDEEAVGEVGSPSGEAGEGTSRENCPQGVEAGG